MYKVAIIGCGRIFNKHFEALNHNKKYFKIVGVFDRDPKKNVKTSKLCSTKIYSNINDLIKATKPDIVSILVESGNHLKVCKEVIKKHNIKNFIIEKPLDISVKKIKIFSKFIKKKKTNIFTVKQNRFNKAVIQAKKLIDQNLLGKIFMTSVSCKWKRDQSYYDLANWRGKRQMDGGVLMNQAIHHVDLLLYLIGDIEYVSGFGDTRFVKIESENIAVATLKFKNKCLGVIEATTATQPEDYEGSITIMGDKGTLKIGGFASNKISYFKNIYKTKVNIEKFNTNILNVYGVGHQIFYKYVGNYLSEKLNNNSFDISSSIKSVATVESIINSFKSRKIEKVDY